MEEEKTCRHFRKDYSGSFDCHTPEQRRAAVFSGMLYLKLKDYTKEVKNE